MKSEKLLSQLRNGVEGCWAPLRDATLIVINHDGSLPTQLETAGLIEYGSVDTMDAGLAWIDWTKTQSTLNAGKLAVTSNDARVLQHALAVAVPQQREPAVFGESDTDSRIS